MGVSRYFAVGTRPPRNSSSLAILLSKSIHRIVMERNEDGTWGGPDSLDQFICTNHVVMTLMAAGLQPTSELLKPALEYLADLNTKRLTTFFWRSGPLLNVAQYENIVNHDIEYLFSKKERAGGNPDYPALFFLLKLLRFKEGGGESERIDETVKWILSEWSSSSCWYGKTSITSMGLSLMADMKELPTEIFERSVEFLKKSYGICNDGRSGFSNNIIDDAFTIYNIYERFDVLNKLISNEVFSLLDECLNHIIRLQDNGYWYSEPPFGGSVDSPEYASAVIVRAAIARNIAKIRSFEFDLALALADTGLNSLQRKNDMTSRIESFWGPLELNDLGYCFIAMPFDRRRDEIYNDYVKKPIERKLKLKCLRVDEICKSTQIPNDIFNMIKDSSVVISDVSDRNSNVFYELGMAHVMGKPCVIIVEDKKDVPFDVASIRYIEYGNTPGSWKKLSEDIVKFVENSIGIEKS